jgi:hypothetical protein
MDINGVLVVGLGNLPSRVSAMPADVLQQHRESVGRFWNKRPRSFASIRPTTSSRAA